ncbi:N-acetylglutamate synthase, CG3035 family [Corynebacterium ammoniagenes]|uniref:N-acetyltransferase n=2 Tax=Corynebacterium ammoniagenes TaxID=1697 RepID=A0AAV5G768_CORAM|nr:GNAT family N-acetyltransferase [Corynebacterium ammoniagenes]APT83471.1 GNAT family acetyltransferase [Corynebacterium ammoniagenes DSM 20306]AQS74473.1 GNAT family N-acetyltransferase [Corynebacterium ammoniagenes]EFG81355.1 acetyltransferase, GNAT family [Corynebacterium ammoniagenes DSM 20306]NMF32139.1 GNAT family N-acetyltransferase [Corynebacterium ammoniagenes]GJN43151.1 N-acetyltransferase [Corynebacterium ammoniagenes]
MAKAFRSDPITINDRVVARRTFQGGGHSDVIGHVMALEPLTIRPQMVGGYPSVLPEVVIPAEELYIVKKLSPRTVRNSDIRHVEVASAKSYPGHTDQWTSNGQWLMRAGDGTTLRTNSAIPLGPSAGFEPAPLAELTTFYSSRNLPCLLLVPERIGNSALKIPHAHVDVEKIVMTRDLAELEDIQPYLDEKLEVDIAASPTPEWLELSDHADTDLAVPSLVDAPLAFFTTPLGAVLRATITESENGTKWLGIACVKVSESARRQRLAARLVAAAMAWGQAAGAEKAYLQVSVGNDAAVALYEKLGMLEHHRHRYLKVIPGNL